MNLIQQLSCMVVLLIALLSGSNSVIARDSSYHQSQSWWESYSWWNKWNRYFKRLHQQKKKDFDLTILHMNDHHSHLGADDFDFDVSNLPLTATTEDGSTVSEVEVTYGGFPLLVDLFEKQEKRLKRKNRNYLKIHAGDAITGTLYYTLFEGQADAQMMNQICFDAFALGNHEFDDGDAGLAKFLDALDAAGLELKNATYNKNENWILPHIRDYA